MAEMGVFRQIATAPVLSPKELLPDLGTADN